MVTEKKGAHIPYLDGVRGIAILLVWAGHFFNKYYVFQFGWIGVNLFFILSGYLITGRLFNHGAEDGSRDYFRNFYMRRILRIFPLYYGVLIFFFGILPYLYPRYDVNFSGLYREQAWYWFYLSNWRLYLYGYPGNGTLFVLWSLAAEEQFYLVWPLLLRYLRSAGSRWLIAVVILGSILVRVLAKDPRWTYYSTLTAFEPLLAGALLCILQRAGRLRVYRRAVAGAALGSVIVLGIIFFYNSDLSYANAGLIRYGYTCINILFTGLLYYLLLPARGAGAARKALGAKWLTWLGKYSYGIYIFHWLILQCFVFRSIRELTGRGMDAGLAYAIVMPAAILAVLGCSYLSYRFYEQPFLRLKRSFV